MKQKRVVGRMDINLYIEFYATLRAQGMTFSGWLRKEADKFTKKYKER